MRALFIVLMTLLCTNLSQAQKVIEKTIKTKSGDEVNFDFNRANVKFTTWNKDEILITGKASVNMGENDDAFTVKTKKIDGEWNISTFLKDEKKIPKMIVMSKDGVKTYKKMDSNDDNWNGWNVPEGEEYDYINFGIITEIELEIKVPQNIAMMINSKFGNIDITNFEGQLSAKNRHGHINAVFSKPPQDEIYLKSSHDFVDVSIPSNANLNLQLKSSHGEMLTDLDLDFGEKNEEKKCRNKRVIDAQLNRGGTNVTLVSTHNNIYLREYKLSN